MPFPTPITNDCFGAFVRDSSVAIAGTVEGPLAGLTFGVKDAFDLAGYATGAGNPDWLRTHPPAVKTATAVEQLLAAGASVVGKTLTDELTYSLNGENIHYGTPINPRAPGRIPGGSSNGSAVAVAGELVDFALGTDCGGSVRAPASFCGIYGIRPSYGAVSVEGVFRLAPSFDTVGWFARDAQLLKRVGDTLLRPIDRSLELRRLLLADDALAWCDAWVSAALRPTEEQIIAQFNDIEHVTVAAEGLTSWFEAFRRLQGAEIWAEHGAWIRAVNPSIAPSIRERFEWTATITPTDVAASQPVRNEARERMSQLLRDDGILCLPTTGVIAPLVNLPAPAQADFRARALSLLCIAGLAGLPQINLPMAMLDKFPLGISIVGPHGSDRALLTIATRLAG